MIWNPELGFPGTKKNCVLGSVNIINLVPAVDFHARRGRRPAVCSTWFLPSFSGIGRPRRGWEWASLSQSQVSPLEDEAGREGGLHCPGTPPPPPGLAGAFPPRPHNTLCLPGLDLACAPGEGGLGFS